MTRPRAFTSTVKYVIALLTALVVSVVGATALPAVALAGHGQAKGQQANRADHPGKAHQKGQTDKAHTASTSKSATNPQERGSSAKAQRPAKAEKTQSTGSRSDQARQDKPSRGAPADTSAGTSADKGDPKGNNGTIKLAGFGGTNGPGHSSGGGSTPMHPSNDPHLPCDFSVEGYGFDAVASQSDLTFEQMAPTRGGSAQYGSVPLDGDSHGGGGSTAGYDGVQDFSLTFEGDPHPKHGYHVKLTAVTDYSQGSQTKHKVFWVEPCETTTPPSEETPGGDTPGGDTPGGDTPGGDTPGGDTPGGDTPGGNNGVQQEVDENGGDTSTVVLGAQASVQNSRGTQAAQQSANAEVPTAVEAGLTGDEWSRSVLPLLAVLFGFGTTFVALVRRRTPVQAVTRD
jgi:hypothetical protein